ncbi:MAG: DUF1289 domain-containing protein [Hyphomonadaceae bacterium]
MTAGEPSSPCIKVCIVDGASGLCLGCGRTLAEIAAWGSYDEPRRRAIMATLADRLAKAPKAQPQ